MSAATEVKWMQTIELLKKEQGMIIKMKDDLDKMNLKIKPVVKET